MRGRSNVWPSRFRPFEWASPAGPRARLSIFIFHRVLPRADPLLPWEPDVARFASILAFISNHFNLLDLADAVMRLSDGSLPSAAASITFDDGYLDNLTVAVPLLKRFGTSATFFVATGFMDRGRMWNDTVIESVCHAAPGWLDFEDLGLGRYELSDPSSRVSAYSDVLTRLKHLPYADRLHRVEGIAAMVGLPTQSDLMMNREQVQALRREGMGVGGHTVNHPILSTLDDAQARVEIEDNRAMLGNWLGEAPTIFAYPNGAPNQDYGARDIALVRDAGYRAAVTTAAGAATSGADLYQLPRFTPWDRRLWAFGVRSWRNLDAPISVAAMP